MWDLIGNPEDRFSHNEAHIMEATDTESETSLIIRLNIHNLVIHCLEKTPNIEFLCQHVLVLHFLAL